MHGLLGSLGRFRLSENDLSAAGNMGSRQSGTVVVLKVGRGDVWWGEAMCGGERRCVVGALESIPGC
jgi:hypothetical protein